MNDLSLNGFALSVRGARAVPGHPEFAALRDGEEFAVILRNNQSTRADAKLWIDSVSMGTFRIQPFSSATIERPSDEARKFTFLREGTAKALHAGVPTGASDNGLIKVEFIPEMPSRVWNSLQDGSAHFFSAVPQTFSAASHSYSARGGEECKRTNYASGGTVLGASSDQRFSNVGPLDAIDWSNVTTLHLRLVVEQGRVEPFVSVRNMPHSNPVPPRLPNAPEPFALFQS